jgi:hypothetical protein
MTKKDFALIAKILHERLLAEAGSTKASAAITNTVRAFARHFVRTEPRFELQRFLGAAGHPTAETIDLPTRIEK